MCLLWLMLALGASGSASTAAVAQGPGIENGQWTYLGGDAWHTRYAQATNIDASNFEDLELVWQWNAASFGSSTPRATPTYVDGKLITVTGERRHVVALDPASGELLWSYSEPKTARYDTVTERIRREGDTLHWEATVNDTMLLEPWTMDPQRRVLNPDPEAFFFGDIPCDERDAEGIVDPNVRG